MHSLNTEIRNIFEGKTDLPKEVTEALYQKNQAFKTIKSDLKTSNTELGVPEHPIGYDLENGVYVYKPEILDTYRTYKQELENLKESLHEDMRPVFMPAINSSIKRIDALIKKAIKNEITETMLSVISAPSNKFRMTTPIAFTVIKDAIKDKSLEEYDLSSPESEFKAYVSLTSGAILTGAFANAVKVYAYLTQAGDSVQAEKITAKIRELKAELLALEQATDVETTKEEKKRVNKELTDLRKELLEVRTQMKISRRSQINPAYTFTIGDRVYDKLATQTNDKLNITEIFDTLINSAIDNLKLGYLYQARINAQTGSFVVGATFLGVPLSQIVDILYLPIFDPIAYGKTNRVDSFIRDLKKNNASAISKLEDLALTEEELKSKTKEAQLKALLIFEKASKIGEDVRNLSSFLGIIRDMQVFVEDLDAVDANLVENIGSITTDENDNLILTPRSDFSFTPPNLFRNTPHVQEAYKTHQEIQKIISDNFDLHNYDIRDFASKISSGLTLRRDDAHANASVNKADIRAAYAHYLLAQFTANEIKNTPQKILTFKGKDGDSKVTLSVANSYMNSVANKLNMVKEFAAKHGIRNRFLDTVYVGINSLGVRYISFRGGVNLTSEDGQDLAIDFRKLNRFSITPNGVQFDLDASPYSKSSIQEELLNYAVLAYGLRFSGTSYATYIPPYMLKEIDNFLNYKLEQHKAESGRIFEHFRLSYVIQNAGRIDYIDKDDNETPTAERGKRTFRIPSKDVIEITNPDGTKEQKIVYYDRKVKNGYGEFVRDGFANKIVAFAKVASSSTHDYYQRIGKTTDVVYTPYLGEGPYRLSNHYDASVYTLPYHYIKDDVIYSYTNINKLGGVGTVLYISPDYNFDRTERKLVKITKIANFQTGKIPGYKYTFEEADQVDLLEQNGEVIRKCKIN